jgi:serine/threonine protein phosphatase PrpC
MFDGHAGPDAALMTSKLLHKHIMERLQAKMEVLKIKLLSSDTENNKDNNSHDLDKFGPLDAVSLDSLIVGALEESFLAMVR